MYLFRCLLFLIKTCCIYSLLVNLLPGYKQICYCHISVLIKKSCPSSGLLLDACGYFIIIVYLSHSLFSFKALQSYSFYFRWFILVMIFFCIWNNFYIEDKSSVEYGVIDKSFNYPNFKKYFQVFSSCNISALNVVLTFQLIFLFFVINLSSIFSAVFNFNHEQWGWVWENILKRKGAVVENV